MWLGTPAARYSEQPAELELFPQPTVCQRTEARPPQRGIAGLLLAKLVFLLIATFQARKRPKSGSFAQRLPSHRAALEKSQRNFLDRGKCFPRFYVVFGASNCVLTEFIEPFA